MKKLVVLTGAGISAESGISTFRDSNGLWEGHHVMDVASLEGWKKNPQLVLDFYNQRRKHLLQVNPNTAHLELAKLEKHFDVTIVTQNVDDLHERAGSTNVIHLHGELLKSQSTQDPTLINDIKGWEIKLGDQCKLGSQIRPYIVWFGEMVTMMEQAIQVATKADIFAVIGTSMLVYPAAGLIGYTPKTAPKYVIDIKVPVILHHESIRKIEALASFGTKIMAEEIISYHK